MPLPRPARLYRQNRICSYSTHNINVKPLRFASSSAQIIQPDQPLTPELDPSFAPFLKNVDLSAKRRARTTKRTDLEVINSQLGTSSPTKTNGDAKKGYGLDEDELDGEGEGEFGEGRERREERRSPATVLGSKRLGIAVLPEELVNGVQAIIDEANPHAIRASYMHLNSTFPATPSDRSSQREGREGRRKAEPELAMAQAAGFLPGEYAAARNVMEEMKRRFGRGWWRGLGQVEEGKGPVVVEVSGGLGSGLWALLDAEGNLPSAREEGDTNVDMLPAIQYQFVHATRHGLEVATKLGEDIPSDVANVSYRRRIFKEELPATPSLTFSTFVLSTLPPSAQILHLKQLISLSSPYIVLVDHSTPSGWDAISTARSFLLSQSNPENPLHTLAPCPHDGTCPLLGTRDTCGYRQRLQTPSFLRKTKHKKKGEEDRGYCYLVIAKGERPLSRGISEVGRLGGVAKDQVERDLLKREGKSVLMEVEGGEGVEFEMVSLADVDAAVSTEPASISAFKPLEELAEDEDEMIDALRQEASTWPRLVAPPMKRSGHVIMDACCSNGQIQRLTFSKSHSKQGYHDARKAQWGDLFPFVPKSKSIERPRGVRKLTKIQAETNVEGVMNALLGRKEGKGNGKKKRIERVDYTDPSAGLATAEMGNMEEGEVNEFEDGEEGEVLVWRSGEGESSSTISGQGQRREFSTIAGKFAFRHPQSSCRIFGNSITNVGLQRRFMSARPREQFTSSNGSGSPAPRLKVTINELNRLSSTGIPISVMTAYDYPNALLSESAGADIVLVGDSLSQVALGHDTTTSVTLDEMIHHARAVTRGVKTPFVFADLPFGSFESSVERGVESVLRLIKEAKIDGVKIEGGIEIIPLVKRLTDIGIPVIPHIGLQPQRATSLSGYLVQGRTAEGAAKVLDTALAMQEAGATMLLLEAIPHVLATYITERVSIPTIGIGAGPGTSGQVLVITDVLGTYTSDNKDGEPPVQPRFVRRFGNVGKEAKKAADEYIKEVKARTFPTIGKETYGMKKEEWEAFLARSQVGEVGRRSMRNVDESKSREGGETEDGA